MDSSFPGEWEYLLYCLLYASSIPLYQQRDIEKRIWDSGQGQMHISIVCRNLLRDACFTENGSDHQACCTVHFTSVPLAVVLSSMHASLWEFVFLIFRGGGFDQNPACIFPEIQVFFKIICFFLEGSWNKMVFMGSWGNFGCLYQMNI